MLLIGDIHGKWKEYSDILKKYEPARSVQLGDFAWGFPHNTARIAELEYAMSTFGNDNRYIRGNHDNPVACKNHKFCIDDATYEPDSGIFLLGGASSIDAAQRTQGVDWWDDEELSQSDLYLALDLYEQVKPRIVLTHECPEDVVGNLFNWYRADFPSRTRQALGSMWAIHKPDVWVFGHWHSFIDRTIDGTRFICLDELQTANLNLDNLAISFK